MVTFGIQTEAPYLPGLFEKHEREEGYLKGIIAATGSVLEPYYYYYY